MSGLDDPQSVMNLAIAGSVFVLVLTVWLGAVLVWWRRRSAREERVAQRLGKAGHPGAGRQRVLRIWHDGRQEVTTVESAGGRTWSLLDRLDRLARDAGLGLSPRMLLVAFVGLFAAAFVIFQLLVERPLLALIMALTGPLVLHVYLQHRGSHRTALFERQFVDALQVAVTSLRAGHPLTGALRYAATEIGPPVGNLLGEICQEQELGVSLERAVRAAAARSRNADMKLFASSVAVHLRSGGNLTQMMEDLSAVIRDRMRVNRRLRVLTAQVQLSKRVLVALPFVLFVVLNVLNPGYMEALHTTTAGKGLMVLGGAMLLIGMWFMNRLARIRF